MLRSLDNVLDELLNIKQQIRAKVRRTVPERYKAPVLNSTLGNAAIAEIISDRRASAIGKIGAYELKALRRWSDGSPLSRRERRLLHVNAGVFPPQDAVFDKWAELFAATLGEMDLLAAWNNPGEAQTIERYAPQARLIRAMSLEPYYHQEPWSARLKGKKVAIISPFARSIRQQYERRAKVWPQNPDIVPEMDLAPIKCPLSDGLVKSPYPDWFAACEALKAQMLETKPDVVLIGAGSFSLPLAVAAKAHGGIGIHTGGWTQILFGIKGAVWDKNPLVSRFYNEFWERPLPEERPKDYKKVERGRYW
jgi:hypothetical protein